MIRNVRGAFTLLEVLVVLTVVAILMAVALPNMRGSREGERLRSAARELVAVGGYARQMAIAQGKPASLRFDPQRRVWRLVLPESEQDERRARRAARRGGTEGGTEEEHPRTLPQGVKFTSITRDNRPIETAGRGNFPEITFFPNGGSDGGRVVLTNSRDKSMTVEFSPGTGRAIAYAGSEVTLGERLVAAGGNPGDFEGIDPPAPDSTVAKAAASIERIGRSEEERVSAYQGVAARLMADQRRQWEVQRSGDAADYFANREAGGER